MQILASQPAAEADQQDGEQFGMMASISRNEAYNGMIEKSVMAVQQLVWDLQHHINKYENASHSRNRIAELMLHLLSEEDMKRIVSTEKDRLAALAEAEEMARQAEEEAKSQVAGEGEDEKEVSTDNRSTAIKDDSQSGVQTEDAVGIVSLETAEVDTKPQDIHDMETDGKKAEATTQAPRSEIAPEERHGSQIPLAHDTTSRTAPKKPIGAKDKFLAEMIRAKAMKK